MPADNAASSGGNPRFEADPLDAASPSKGNVGSAASLPLPPPYEGNACTKRDHVVSGVKIDPADERLWKCDCGCTMIGNARVEIRFGLLPHRFPEAVQDA